MAPLGWSVDALVLTQMPFCFARASCVLSVASGMPLVRMPAGFSWMAELMAACCAVGVVPELRSLYVQPRSAAAFAQSFASTTALPLPESRPIGSFPDAGFLLSGVVIPMEVGEFRNWASYAFAAVTPELPEAPPPPPLLLLLLLLLLLPPPPAPLLLLLLLLLHAATPSAEVSAMIAPRVFLIRASFSAGTRSAERWSTNLVESQFGY